MYTAENITEANRNIVSAYVDDVHKKYGTHIDGEIQYNASCKCRWKFLTSLLIHNYNPPKIVVGHILLDGITAILMGIVEHQWNSERLVVYPIVTLQQKKGVASGQ